MSQTCEYDSECPQGMKCSSNGACILECLTDRDCDADETCSTEGACVAAMSGAGGAE
jgi:hypothetical protein